MPQDIYFRDGLISSHQFGDSYFSHVDGYGETHHVFMGGNNIPQRFENAKEFTIAELGFGTGLNFLCTLAAWRQHAHPQGVLTYVGFELHPLSAEEMVTALQRWPQLQEIQQELLALTLPQSAGVHVLTLPQARLELHIGDATTLLPQWPNKADAWYLDGFAPNRNAVLWSDDILQSVYAHTAANGTAATYTVAGFVRRSLQSTGFEVQKTKGFANKREMLTIRKNPDENLVKITA